jgi:hypothetical protein
VYETKELGREEVEMVGYSQSIAVIELGGVQNRGAGQRR